MDQKYEKTDLEFEETDQQIEVFKVFEKSGNGSRIWGNGPKIWGNRSTKLRFLKFLKKAETDQKYEETDQKYEETDQF